MEDKILISSKDELYYINDRQNNKRWIFPCTLKSPTFLYLYNSNTLKGSFYQYFVKSAFLLGFQKSIVSGTINKKLNIKYKNLLKELACTSFSIFTGTLGVNRKFVIEANNGINTLFFLKVPVTKPAEILISKENKVLKEVITLNLEATVTPKIAYYDNDCLALSNIKPTKKIIKTNKLLDIHLKSLDEIYYKTSNALPLAYTTYYQEYLGYIEALASPILNDIKVSKIKEIEVNLKQLINQIEPKLIVHISLAHCDFTPWNMYVTKEKIYVYDWEMGRSDAPMLFDLFHYIFQAEVLIGHKNYYQIKKEIIKQLKKTTSIKIVKQYNLAINTYYALYLLFNVSYYVSRYIRQKDLHVQAHWLIEVWHDALDDFIEQKGEVF